jgi:putative endonuclease
MTARLPIAREEPPPPYGGVADLGRRGEEAAADYLIARGFRILERRFRTRAGEIDLVAEEGETLVFIEVKTRTSLSCGLPAEAVDRRKRARLARAASIYLMRHPGTERPCRFDVVELVTPPGREPRIRLIRDAFQAE